MKKGKGWGGVFLKVPVENLGGRWLGTGIEFICFMDCQMVANICRSRFVQTGFIIQVTRTVKTKIRLNLRLILGILRVNIFFNFI